MTSLGMCSNKPYDDHHNTGNKHWIVSLTGLARQAQDSSVAHRQEKKCHSCEYKAKRDWDDKRHDVQKRGRDRAMGCRQNMGVCQVGKCTTLLYLPFTQQPMFTDGSRRNLVVGK